MQKKFNAATLEVTNSNNYFKNCDDNIKKSQTFLDICQNKFNDALNIYNQAQISHNDIIKRL